MPVDLLRAYTDFVIACDVSKRGMPPLSEINMYSLMMRAEQITQMALAQHQAVERLARDIVSQMRADW